MVLELPVFWLFFILLICLDFPLVWWMFKYVKLRKVRRFSLAPILLIFTLPFVNQPRMPDSILLKISGMIIATLGFVIMMLGGYEFHRRGIIHALSKKESSRIRPEEVSHELVTTGIYRVVRHPQYLGLITFFIGYFLVFKALYSLYLIPLIMIWFTVIAFVEEKYDLEVIFGDDYREYKKKVGMLFPKACASHE